MKILLLFLIFPLSCFSNVYYVSNLGNDLNSGSQSEPWKTISYATTKANAGDIVYIKSGTYANEQIVFKNSGTESNPIIFQGEDVNNLPVLDGPNSNMCVNIDKRAYIELRNLYFTNCLKGIWAYGSNHITIDNVVMDNINITNADGEGISLYLTTNFVIKNCTVTDAGMSNFVTVRCSDGLIEDCKSYAKEYLTGSTDYHIVIQDAQNVIIKNCQAHNLHSLNGGHPGHGIGIKDTYRNGYNYPHSTNNKIIDCSAYNMGEYFFVAHEAYGNTFENCTAIGNYELQNYWSEGINIRDGAHDNIFKNCSVKNTRTSIAIQNTEEGPMSSDGVPGLQICSNNIIYNTTLKESNTGVEMWSANNNTFRKCTFDSINRSLFKVVWEAGNTGNSIDSSQILNIKGEYLNNNWNSPTEIKVTNSNFWNNTFVTPTGNTSINPYIAIDECQEYKELLSECLTVFKKSTISAKLKATMRNKITNLLNK